MNTEGRLTLKVRQLGVGLIQANADVERLRKQLAEAVNQNAALLFSYNTLVTWLKDQGIGFDSKAFEEHLLPQLKEKGFRVLSPEEAAAEQKARAERAVQNVVRVDFGSKKSETVAAIIEAADDETAPLVCTRCGQMEDAHPTSSCEAFQ